MKCSACMRSEKRPACGAYRLQCMACCTRLVLSAYPSKTQAAVMLEAIARFPGNPGREQVLECVRQELARRHSAPPKLVTD